LKGETVLSFLGLLSFLAAAIEGVCAWFGHPLTSVSWSPLLFAVLGGVLVMLEALQRDGRPT
jgi:hypothetical protein